LLGQEVEIFIAADITGALPNVRFTPERGTSLKLSSCPLRANKRHRITLLEREDALPVILHAYDGPALVLSLVVKRLGKCADFGVR
jgi:hypothetical protein